MSQYKTVSDLIREYDLDALEVSSNRVYLHYGRDLTVDEHNNLQHAIKKLREANDE